MFVLSVVDRKNNKLELLSSRSQVGIDNFTTCFLREESLLKELGLETGLYNVVVENTTSKEEIGFTPSKLRNVVYLYKDANRENDFIEKASKTDAEGLYNYFLNELLRFEKDSLSRYDNDRLASLQRIIYYFDTEEDVVDKNKESLKRLMKVYLYQNYSYLKELYKYLTMSGEDFGQDYDDKTKKEVVDRLNEMKDKIESVKDFSGSGFVDGVLPKYKEKEIKIDQSEEDILSYYHTKDYDDYDDARIDLDMYMDQKRFDLEQKNNFIKKNNKKIGK